MVAPLTRIPHPAPSLPADEAWREKQRKLAEARARLRAEKAAPPPAEPAHEEAATPLLASPPDPPEQEAIVFGPFLPSHTWFPFRFVPGVKVAAIGENILLPPLDGDASSLHIALARALDEKQPEARKFIKRLVSRLGDDAARALYADTQAIEASGGMLTEHGDRRRSPCGVFFKLARTELGADAFLQAQVLTWLARGRVPRRWR